MVTRSCAKAVTAISSMLVSGISRLYHTRYADIASDTGTGYWHNILEDTGTTHWWYPILESDADISDHTGIKPDTDRRFYHMRY